MSGAHQSQPDLSDGLSKNKYWEIIDLSISKGYNQDSQEALLSIQLQQLSIRQIIDFQIYTEQLMAESYRSDLWCAADIINHGCSDDSFDYFRGWLISRGQEVFEAAMEDPDGTLSRVVDPSVSFYDFERFLYVAGNAYEQQTGLSIYEVITGRIPKTPKISFDWKQNDPASYKRVCPRLFALYEGYRDKHKQPGNPKRINTDEFRRKYRRR